MSPRWIDLCLDPSAHRQRLGAAAIFREVRHLIEERGHNRITVNQAERQCRRDRCYEKVGFRRVG